MIKLIKLFFIIKILWNKYLEIARYSFVRTKVEIRWENKHLIMSK
jgi:hypothetical protein